MMPHRRIEPKEASALFYAMQVASSNLDHLTANKNQKAKCEDEFRYLVRAQSLATRNDSGMPAAATSQSQSACLIESARSKMGDQKWKIKSLATVS